MLDRECHAMCKTDKTGIRSSASQQLTKKENQAFLEFGLWRKLFLVVQKVSK